MAFLFYLFQKDPDFKGRLGQELPALYQMKSNYLLNIFEGI